MYTYIHIYIYMYIVLYHCNNISYAIEPPAVPAEGG